MLIQLDELLTDPAYAADFLSSLAEYLLSAAPDGGVDSDRLYMTGFKLGNANVWHHIDPSAVLNAAGDDIASETVLVFAEGLPDAVARAFLAAQPRVSPRWPPVDHRLI